MGPTASGKTQLAIELVQQLPCDIISVDSAMVYRGMDIGTAKPTLKEQRLAPHRLLDLVEPNQPYSAGQFCLDANHEIRAIQAKGRIPLLVGGTMLYFRALQQGLSPLPPAQQEVRQRLLQEAELAGWDSLYQRLCTIDPQAAARIMSQDRQRIQRALEIYEITGHSLTDFCRQSPAKSPNSPWINIALIPRDRGRLQQRIHDRFNHMLEQGFVAEVQNLRQRGDFSADLPALRAVGYRQVWRFLEGQSTEAQMRDQAIIATRQLAKRQLTWLRSWPQLQGYDSEQAGLSTQVVQAITARLKSNGQNSAVASQARTAI